MACPALTNKGGKLYISEQPVDCDMTLSELAVLGYVFVPGVGSIGDTGIEQDVVTYPTTDAGLTSQGKGDAVARNWDIEVLDAPSEARDILDEASGIGNNDNYATRIEWPNGDVEFSIVQVSSRTAVKGASSGVRVIRYTMVPSFVPIVTNSIPVASNVAVAGDYYVGGTLAGDYDYYSPLGLPESGSAYQWSADGSAIPGADDLTYVIDEQYEGAMISFGVIPSDGLSEGNESASVAGGPVVLFTPELLFQDGLYGGAFSTAQRMYKGEPNLYQDEAMTIPVASDGDPVWWILDQSGNGNHRRATAAGRRAIYHTDGTHEWITLDGIDDFYRTVGDVDMKGSSSSSFALSIVQPPNDSTAKMYMELSANSEINAGSMAAYQGGANVPGWRHRGTTIRTIAGTTETSGNIVDLAGRGRVTPPLMELYQNGIKTAESALTQGSGTLLNYPMYSMSRAGLQYFYGGNWYCDMLISRFLTPEQMAQVNSYLESIHP